MVHTTSTTSVVKNDPIQRLAQGIRSTLGGPNSGAVQIFIEVCPFRDDALGPPVSNTINLSGPP